MFGRSSEAAYLWNLFTSAASIAPTAMSVRLPCNVDRSVGVLKSGYRKCLRSSVSANSRGFVAKASVLWLFLRVVLEYVVLQDALGVGLL
jgi:hypothetical protein